jgi:DNA-binding transcriptional LysR family regulator
VLYDTALLRTFIAVCDSGSFTKAANQVNLTQSAVSLHVKRLEEQVGSRLIVRNVRGLRLTEQGEVLLSYARRILALYKEAEARLSRDASGLIRIGVPEYFDLHTLSSLLGQFSARYPAVKTQIELGLAPRFPRWSTRASRSRHRQLRDQGRRRHPALPRAAHLGGRAIVQARSRRAGAAGALSAILPLAPACARGARQGRPRLDRRHSEHRHRRHPRRARCSAYAGG